MATRGYRDTTGADAASIDLPGGTQSIQRAVAVLRILATARDTGLGLTEISKQAELTRPTTHRILGVLVAEGIVEQRPTRRYVVGEQIPLLALARRTRDPLLEIVSPHLKAAVGKIGDTGFLTRRAGSDTVCVARQLGTYPIQVLAWDVGERRPLGVTNAGIAILSGMAAVFALHGLTQIAFAARVRQLAGWHWFLLSGLIALATAALMVMKLPYNPSFTPAMLGGVSLVSVGWAYVATSRIARHA